MSACPRCHRPIAAARAQCLYCGATLPPEAAPRPAPPAASPEPISEPPADRALLVVRLDGAESAAVQRGLALTAFEADLRVRRGGLQLVRALPREEGEREAARLEAEGLAAWAIPENEARARPLLVRGGRQAGGALRLMLQEGEVTVSTPDLILVVRGPITREYQAEATSRRRPRTATPAPGYRVHLWRRDELRPVELDPDGFDFGPAAATVSSHLQLLEWVEALRGPTPVDDEFKREPPVLSVATAATGAAALLRAARTPRRGDGETVILDNLDQFRVFSGWRAAVERRRRATPQ